ncbi:hypothetical protein FRC11_002809, partial [Ceratobasidium sp. 423]
GADTSIKVFVQKETHVIGIPGNKIHYSDSMMHPHDDPDGAESTGSRAGSAKLHTSPIQ